MANIMTTREIAEYLKLHQITVCKLSKEGKIPAIRIGRVWRYDILRIARGKIKKTIQGKSPMCRNLLWKNPQ